MTGAPIELGLQQIPGSHLTNPPLKVSVGRAMERARILDRHGVVGVRHPLTACRTFANATMSLTSIEAPPQPPHNLYRPTSSTYNDGNRD